MDPRKFASWLKRTREARGLEVGELAQRAGVNRSTVQNIERGRKDDRSPISTFVALARGLDLELGYLLHMAGFDIGREGVNMQRLVAVEEAMALLDDAAPAIRRELAEAMQATDDEQRLNRLGQALGKLDLVTERLRERRAA